MRPSLSYLRGPRTPIAAATTRLTIPSPSSLRQPVIKPSAAYVPDPNTRWTSSSPATSASMSSRVE
jgi:hypothetical protein